MPDTQYRPLGAEPAPAGWTLPPALEIVPKIAYASFDGSGAAGSFKPCLRLISDAGLVAGEYVTDDTVAAGGSADVSWFRGLKGKAGAAAATGLQWAQLSSGGVNIASSGFNTAAIDFGAHTVYTNTTGMFDSQLHGGVHTLTILQEGVYLVWGEVNVGTSGAPPAGSLLQCLVSAVFSGNWAGGNLYAPYENIGGGSYGAGVDHGTLVLVASPSAPAPQAVFLEAGQNTGATQLGNGYLFALRLGDPV